MDRDIRICPEYSNEKLYEIIKEREKMPDKEKVFDAFRNCITEPKCKDCPWEQCKQFNQKKAEIPFTLALDVLNLLKEQQEKIEKLESDKRWDECPDTMGKW